MPIYEFECECGNKKEELVSIGANSIKCLKCSKYMKKVISLSSFYLKGRGWAKDGYSKIKSKYKK